MNRVLWSLVFAANASAALAQNGTPDSFPTSQQVQNSGPSDALSTPAAAPIGGNLRVLPPDVPPRPALPSGAPDSASLSVAPGAVKESLAWRVKAHKLRISSAAQQRTLASTYDAALMALIGALSSVGLRVQTLNSRAGELLAAPTDALAKQRFIFVVAEMPPGTVTIKAQPLQANKDATTLIESIFAALTNQAYSKTQRGND